MFDSIRDPGVWLTIATVAILLVVPATGEWTQWREEASHDAQATPTVPVHAPGTAWDHEDDHHPLASPAVAEVGGQQLTITATYPASEGEAGSVVALEPDRTVAWEQTPSPLTTGGFVASPAILEDDGETAVIAAKAEDSTVYRLAADDGTVETSWKMGSTNRDVLVSSPTIADVTGDSTPEIVVGGSSSDNEGAVYVLDADLDVLFEHELNAPVWSSPLVHDVDEDGADELVVSTGVPDAGCIVFGTLHPTNDPKTGDDQGRLYVFDATSDGWDLAWDEPLKGPTMSSPAAGDIDADGDAEIVVGSQGPRGGCTNIPQVQMDGHLDVYDDGGSLVDRRDGSLVLSVTTPLVHDLHDDGVPEIVHGTWNGLAVYDGQAGSLSLSSSYEITDDDRHDQDHWVLASPAVVDLDDDGGSDLVGLSIPVDINEQSPLESDVKPGAVFAVSPEPSHDATTDIGPLTVDGDGLEPRWVYPTPDDGGLSGPVAADVTGDGWGEIVAGTGFPVIGDSTTTHVIAANNPVIDGISADPEIPQTVDDITFSADVRDRDTPNDAVEHAWTFGDGAQASGAEPVHSYDDDGTYTIELEVRDPEGHAWTQTRTLAVANTPPTVDTAIETTAGSLEVSLSGQAADPDGTVTDINWSLGDGNTSDAETLTHTYATGGSYEASFQAEDDDGDVSWTAQPVHVNRFPSLSGPATAAAVEGEGLSLAFPYDDPDGDDVHVEEVDGAPGASAEVHDEEIVLHWKPGHDIASREDSPVTVTVELAVEDEARPAGVANHTVEVDVADANRAPEISAPSQVQVSSGQRETIAGFVDDPDHDDVDLTVEGLPNSSTFTTDPIGWQIVVEPPNDAVESTHDVTVRADDGLDETQHELALAILPNQPPDPDIHGPSQVEAHTVWNPNAVTFEGTAEDPEDDEIRRWAWNASGIHRDGQQLTHRFEEHGSYWITLTAWDTHLAAAQATHLVEVDDALTGDLTVHRGDMGPNVERIVHVQVAYEDGTPLANTAVDLEVVHEGLDRTTAEDRIVTDDDGWAQARLAGDMGLPFFLPGEHTVRIETEAGSLPSAPVQDDETLAMDESFRVSTLS